jgi:hypothetical protein
MKDLDGQEIFIGDRVAYQSGGRSPALHITEVLGFTPKMVKVSTYRSITPVATVHPYKLVKLSKQQKE